VFSRGGHFGEFGAHLQRRRYKGPVSWVISNYGGFASELGGLSLSLSLSLSFSAPLSLSVRPVFSMYFNPLYRRPINVELALHKDMLTNISVN
jgi:hypothetical protein